MKKSWIATVVVAVLTAGALAACSGDPAVEKAADTTTPVETSVSPPAEDAGSDASTVADTVVNFAFNPDTLTVPSNGEVVWTVSEGTHRITATSGASFDSGTLQSGDTFTWNPDGNTSAVDFKCAIHPSMTGHVVVEGPA